MAVIRPRGVVRMAEAPAWTRSSHTSGRCDLTRRLLWDMPDAEKDRFNPPAQPAPDYEFDQRIAW